MNKVSTLAAMGVPDAALTWRSIRSSGPGGQHVNKVATAVQLSCDLNACELSDAMKARLRMLAGRRVSSDDVLTISAQRLRTQEQNKRDALERLYALIEQAHVVPKPRRATKPTFTAKRQRLEHKIKRGRQKQLRGKVSATE